MCARRGFFMIVTRAMQTVTSYEIQVEVKDGEIIVALPSSGFHAVYFKRAGSPFLTLRQRTKTDDHEEREGAVDTEPRDRGMEAPLRSADGER